MKKEKLFVLSLLIFTAAYVCFSCQPALGASWYKRSVKDAGDKKTLTVQSITVCGVTLYSEANGEDFVGKVNAKDAILYPDDVSAVVKDNTGAAVEVSVRIKGSGGQANLKEGESVTVPVILKAVNDANLEIQKYLFLEQDSSMGGSGADYNPKDPQGNKKFIVKIKTEHIEADPWDYYKEGEPDSSDDGNFNSAKFDEWILNMPSMEGIIASYKFREGSWTGTPEMCNNVPSGIGSGVKAISDVKVYRYKNRTDRWAAIGYTPAPDPKDERFYFFKFTAHSLGGAVGGKHGSSMFCVDRYSKFLFYYSEPTKIKSVFGNAVPEDWTDYAAPTEGQHTQFSEPFYMTDPVGFVKEDGSVVLYQWIKDNINNADYHPKQNPAYTQPAGRKANKAGHSPYKNDKITVTKKTITKDKNPKYTAVKPVILEQPKDGYAKLNSPELVFEVKTEPVPEGETLSYQWYKAENKTETGTEIPGATEASYKITDTSTETKCYFYCIVKNTNADNNKSEQTESERAKCHITDGQIQSDALNPEITEQPKGTTLRLNSAEQLTLRVKAVSKDGGTLSYQWFKVASSETEGTAVTDADKAEYTFTPDTTSAGITYYYCLVTNTNNTVQGEQSASKKSAYAAIEIEESYKVEFSVLGEEGGTLAALHNGSPIKSGAYIKKGEQVKFIATPEPNSRYKVKKWFGVPEDAFKDQDKTFAVMTVESANLNVSVSFITMFLKITPKIHNESLQSWSTADGDHFNHKYIDGVHLSHKNAVQVTGGSNVTESWDYMFSIENNSGKWIKVKSGDFIKVGTDKSANAAWLTTEFSSFSDLKISFSNYLIKANRHDYWWAEWTTWGGGTVYPLQAIDDNSIFPLVYNETTGMWTVDKANVNIKRSDDIPLPAEFAGTKPNPNRRISYKRVTITYDENFTLADGEEKDFVITYEVDNHDETRSKGKIKVIYTISWK